ncbi:MAG: DNA repair protein RadA [Desulforudis sp.]|nr:MAG: DNA repair protein RadA [Desulforudis sp.]
MRCRECGYYSPRWLGRCPGCGQWETFVAEAPGKPKSRKTSNDNPTSVPVPLNTIPVDEETRYPSGIAELDRVLGGGFVPGSVVLVGGDPGIGKSTLLLQSAHQIGCSSPVLYVSGEESGLQVRLRAERLGTLHPNLYLASETDIEVIEQHIKVLGPRVVIIDSIQTAFQSDLAAVPGSVGQVRECTLRLTRVAKTTGIPILLVGHVTKEGVLAGPRTLEHMVDTVLYLEGERHHSFRVLRGVKNRFGSTNEIGIFEMTAQGLVEVANPSRLFLSSGGEPVSGATVVSSLEGTRPLFVEIQALVSPTGFGNPRRMTAGVDYNRVVLMAAVLEKRVGLGLSNQDIYVNAVGGVKLMEPAVDLGIALALASGFRDVPLAPGAVVIGEVGLTGEVRPVRGINQRLREAAKLGFNRAVVPEANRADFAVAEMEINAVRTVAQALEHLADR